MNPRRILHNRCNKFAKSLLNWMVLQKWCNNFAKLLQLFYKGYCKMFAIGLQNLCKILAFISNLTKPVFAWFCKQFAMLLGERHQKVCKKSAKDRIRRYTHDWPPPSDWPPPCFGGSEIWSLEQVEAPTNWRGGANWRCARGLFQEGGTWALARGKHFKSGSYRGRTSKGVHRL